MTFAERFEKALKHWRPRATMTARLQELAGEKVARGGSYGSLVRYLKDEGARPGLDFIYAAADALGVRREWLLDGQGEMTEAEQVAAAVLEADEGRKKGMTVFPLGATPDLPRFGEMTDRGKGYVRQLWSWYAYASSEGVVGAPATAQETAAAITEALAGPLKALGIDPGQLHIMDFEHYVAGLAGQLTLILRWISPEMTDGPPSFYRRPNGTEE
jgi:transcriptional regulator with XRE-family HTH domain